MLVCTWFGAGHLRPAPGTWGSLAALPVAWVIAYLGGPLLLLPAALLVFLVGWAAATAVLDRVAVKDPSWIVVDEVGGLFLTLAFVPLTAPNWVVGFVLFRLFDIVKPWPASWADRKVGGGLGVMLDDVFAGLYAAALLAIISHIIGKQ